MSEIIKTRHYYCQKYGDLAMTNAELIQKIRKEIINRIDKRRLSEQAKNELVSILSFLDTLPEQPMEGLEEEIEEIYQFGRIPKRTRKRYSSYCPTLCRVGS